MEVKRGDKVVIRNGDTTQVAEVETVHPNGGFSCHWYEGQNEYAPKLPGHHAAVFGPDGKNVYAESPWELAAKGKPEIVDHLVKTPPHLADQGIKSRSINSGWLRKMAEKEDGCTISVGGLVHDLEQSAIRRELVSSYLQILIVESMADGQNPAWVRRYQRKWEKLKSKHNPSPELVADVIKEAREAAAYLNPEDRGIA